VLGKQVEIVVVDDGSNPKDSALAAQKAVSQKVVAVIGSYGSSVTNLRPTSMRRTNSSRSAMAARLSG
jgi:hypothetical protein